MTVCFKIKLYKFKPLMSKKNSFVKQSFINKVLMKVKWFCQIRIRVTVKPDNRSGSASRYDRITDPDPHQGMTG